jgi:hypothetical protein
VIGSLIASHSYLLLVVTLDCPIAQKRYFSQLFPVYISFPTHPPRISSPREKRGDCRNDGSCASNGARIARKHRYPMTMLIPLLCFHFLTARRSIAMFHQKVPPTAVRLDLGCGWASQTVRKSHNVWVRIRNISCPFKCDFSTDTSTRGVGQAESGSMWSFVPGLPQRHFQLTQEG